MASGWDQIAGGSIDQDSLASSPKLVTEVMASYLFAMFFQIGR
jgi:hypothetical protein